MPMSLPVCWRKRQGGTAQHARYLIQLFDSTDAPPKRSDRAAVLRVRDVLEPLHHLAVFLFLNGDVGDAGGRTRAVPVLLAGGKPNNIAGADFLDGAAF